MKGDREKAGINLPVAGTLLRSWAGTDSIRLMRMLGSLDTCLRKAGINLPVAGTLLRSWAGTVSIRLMRMLTCVIIITVYQNLLEVSNGKRIGNGQAGCEGTG